MDCCTNTAYSAAGSRGLMGPAGRSWVETTRVCVEPEVRGYSNAVCEPIREVIREPIHEVIREPVCEPPRQTRIRSDRTSRVIRDHGPRVISTRVGTTCDPCRPRTTMSTVMNTVEPCRVSSLGAGYTTAATTMPVTVPAQYTPMDGLYGGPAYGPGGSPYGPAMGGPAYGPPGADDWIRPTPAPDQRLRRADGSIADDAPTSPGRFNFAGASELTPGRYNYSGDMMNGGGGGGSMFGADGAEGSVTRLSDGSLLYPDGTIRFADGTVKRPANVAALYKPAETYTEQEVTGGIAALGALQQQLADVKERLSGKAAAELKEQLNEMESHRRTLQHEIHRAKQEQGETSAQAKAKEEQLERMMQQYVEEVRRNAEALGWAKGLQGQLEGEAEALTRMINEAVMRREQELLYEKEKAVADMQERALKEREAQVAQERARAENQSQAKIDAERQRLQADLDRLQDRVQTERQRAEAEHEQALYEKQRALQVQQELDALKAATPEKKKKKKKGKKGRKGKKKAKKGAAKRPALSRFGR